MPRPLRALLASHHATWGVRPAKLLLRARSASLKMHAIVGRCHIYTFFCFALHAGLANGDRSAGTRVAVSSPRRDHFLACYSRLQGASLPATVPFHCVLFIPVPPHDLAMQGHSTTQRKLPWEVAAETAPKRKGPAKRKATRPKKAKPIESPEDDVSSDSMAQPVPLRRGRKRGRNTAPQVVSQDMQALSPDSSPAKAAGTASSDRPTSDEEEWTPSPGPVAPVVKRTRPRRRATEAVTRSPLASPKRVAPAAIPELLGLSSDEDSAPVSGLAHAPAPSTASHAPQAPPLPADEAGHAAPSLAAGADASPPLHTACPVPVQAPVDAKGSVPSGGSSGAAPPSLAAMLGLR